ncbi:MAG: hypothetical protein UIM24_04845 [Clostridia bacterium]|nr:hypothetical protein [Clostridia bacterium]
MRAYICSVAAVAIMAALSDILIPKNWQKYISILTGAILLITLSSPLLKLRGITLPSFSLPESEYYEYSVNSEIALSLEQSVEDDIRNRLEKEFGVVADSDVSLNIIDEKIAGVQEIIIYSREDAAITSRLKEVYGCNNIIWR